MLTEQQAQAEAAPRFTHRQVLEILAGLMLAMLTSMISTSVVGTALPTIVGTLGGQDQLAWVASATLLTMTASTPIWGKLSDLYGRKLMFQVSLVLFAVASVAAGFAQDMGQLIAARAVQGIGAGGLAALPQIILGDVVEPRERGRYSGYMGAVFGVSTVTGPLLGGFIVDNMSWRWTFWICVPLAVVAFAVIQKVLRLPFVRRDARVDWWGATFITGGTTALMLLLSLGGKEFDWNSPWTYGLGAASLAMLGLSVLAERRAADPILPPHLFRNRTFVLTSLASLLVGAAMFGALMFLPQYLQIVKGMSPTGSGLMTLPLVMALLVSSIMIGRFVSRTGRWKVFPVAGMLLVALGLFLLSRLHVDSSLLVVALDNAVLGVGLGASMQILILAAQNAVGRTDLASVTSGVTFFRSLGGAVGVAAFGAILSNRLTTELVSLARAAKLPLTGGSVPSLGSPEAIHRLPAPVLEIILEAFTRAMSAVFLVGVPIAVLGAVAALLLKEIPLRSAQAAAAPAPVSK
ncbi:EmrB/QacA subfamily drug resistance transporter [Streptosporangium becharense]|uniref:EmrB/QacA subfamily drug resistance transporter n=1 Tax=Streptosporangium becharense TaxID=1816182 RepID=A0A7W9MJF1_9ACTN|nr:MDR family MFS transporter [Streptosporangium becharense]MBB2911674.1 EmrB/QacA subfamily drug resistance transporter [Streptosporangium becharense]MBB5822508.1 EmrB/QacA subfamily drug resistance transporter [Streptosporangium becharense]